MARDDLKPDRIENVDFAAPKGDQVLTGKGQQSPGDDLSGTTNRVSQRLVCAEHDQIAASRSVLDGAVVCHLKKDASQSLAYRSPFAPGKKVAGIEKPRGKLLRNRLDDLWFSVQESLQSTRVELHDQRGRHGPNIDRVSVAYEDLNPDRTTRTDVAKGAFVPVELLHIHACQPGHDNPDRKDVAVVGDDRAGRHAAELCFALHTVTERSGENPQEAAADRRRHDVR